VVGGWGRAKLSSRFGRETGPDVFVFKPNIVIFEARIIAIPRLPLSEVKYIPVRQNVPTLRSHAQPFLDPLREFLAAIGRAFLSPFSCHQKCRYSPDFSPFSGSFTSNHDQLAWPDPFSMTNRQNQPNLKHIRA
jgi:hypothetical protein